MARICQDSFQVFKPSLKILLIITLIREFCDSSGWDCTCTNLIWLFLEEQSKHSINSRFINSSIISSNPFKKYDDCMLNVIICGHSFSFYPDCEVSIKVILKIETD